MANPSISLPKLVSSPNTSISTKPNPELSFNVKPKKKRQSGSEGRRIKRIKQESLQKSISLQISKLIPLKRLEHDDKENVDPNQPKSPRLTESKERVPLSNISELPRSPAILTQNDQTEKTKEAFAVVGAYLNSYFKDFIGTVIFIILLISSRKGC
eukprot:TRINITY_DN6069_c0_g1_i2.p1 TRINITY_DN6069_c0_g1~~TRINITY_DN6069_c0_g1_i2.p1  ORF type:complete len:156 (+),score=21.98 TRINITY_DN6069_c0_g1_i2:299-766(+)